LYCGGVTWPQLPIFSLIQRLGSIPDGEMFRFFNMGLGMLVIIPPEQQEQVMELLHGEAYKVDEVLHSSRIVRIESGA
jgi:phosphoribosylformylglycinamidine cyclo-ligase